MSSESHTCTVEELVASGILAPPLDGNHGAIHPKASDFVPSGIPFIMASDMHDGRVDTTNCAFISQKQASSLRKGFSKSGDVLLSHKATIGRTALVGDMGYPYLVLTPQVTYYRVLKPTLLNNRFLKYYFDSQPFQETLAAWAGSGSTRAYLGITAQRKLPITLPPISTQEAIAETVGALDDRISLLRETNATLEAIAQALFKSWFVDFDPVHAKQQGRTPEGMDEATAALFPDSFDESELGLMPRGWRAVPIGDVAEIVKGKSYSSKDLIENRDTALVTLKSFERGGGFRLDGFKPYIGNYKPNQVVLPGDLIVAYTDVTQAAELIGKPAIVIGVDEYKTLVASLDVGIVRPNAALSDRQFLYGLFKTDAFQSHTLAHTSGTTVLHLAKDGIGSFRFVCPPIMVIRAFAVIADAITSRRQTNVDQMRNLATLRDTLLPRLISGQLRLPEAEAMLESV
ncbi:restriction endonuclease subunit S [Methylomonas sp. MK1]|uniref:restriction endonuclease subunit S n=1 Tax=Methylomonas sp. MK1 TaxID=1131552 RepID=UPI000376A3EC|nr:restriction endonuclease subunit S [Methylomonas sp. MK1]